MEPSKLILTNGKVISEDSPVFVIAEIGQNHQGDINIAKKLIQKAKECQVDCVKFQKSCLSEKFTEGALNVPYESPHSWGKTYGEHKRHLEFSEADYLELQQFAKQIDILFTASAMDIISLRFLSSLNVPFIKIGSGDSTNKLLLKEAAHLHKPLIISTGMCSMEDVEDIFNIISKEHTNFSLLHCVSSYPTRPEDGNLLVISKFKSKFPIQIGYSGHEIGYNLTLAAVALGAKIVERHITLDKSWKGNDHSCSLNVNEFRDMVLSIREIEKGLGNTRILLPCEMECWKKLGKSIVAAEEITSGTVLNENNVKIKVSNPQGIPCKMLSSVMGKRVTKSIKKDYPIFVADLT